MRALALVLVLLAASPAFAAEIQSTRHEVQSEDYARSTDVVFVSEGYTKDEEEEFYAEAGALAHQLLTYKAALPIRESAPLNGHFVFVPSSAKGAPYRAGEKAGKTALRAHVDEDGTLLADDARADTLAARGSSGDVDVVVILVRFAKGKAGSHDHVRPNADFPSDGGRVRFFADDTLSFIHEFAHACYGLDDEYWEVDARIPPEFVGGVAQCPNTTCYPSGARWGLSADELFEGGSCWRYGVWRPENLCRMNQTRNQGFCFACEDAIRRSGRRERPGQPELTKPAPGAEVEGVVDVRWRRGPGIAPISWELHVRRGTSKTVEVEERWLEGQLSRATLHLTKPGKYTITLRGHSVGVVSKTATASFVLVKGVPEADESDAGHGPAPARLKGIGDVLRRAGR